MEHWICLNAAKLRKILADFEKKNIYSMKLYGVVEQQMKL